MSPDQPHASTPQVGTNDQVFNTLLGQVRNLVQSARKTATTTINNRAEQIAQMPSGQYPAIFSLSWSQYIFLLAMDNPNER